MRERVLIAGLGRPPYCLSTSRDESRRPFETPTGNDG